MSWADAASSVHVEDSGATTTWRPGKDARVGLKVKIAAVSSRKIQGIVDAFWVAGKGESVCAFAPGTSRYLSVTNHVGVEDGEPRNH